jgi:DNA-binding transcriptional LysR family regulator
MPPILDSRRLLAFATVARVGSFTRAARELSLTQSAVSHAIRGLEDELGVILFRREGRTVRLTAGGRYLAERADVILGEMRATRTGVQAVGRDAD